MATKEFHKDVLGELEDCGDEELTFISCEQDGHSRWSAQYTLLFSDKEGRIWSTGYQRGLTEYQDNGTEWDYENGGMVTCTEMEAYTESVTKYREKDPKPRYTGPVPMPPVST